MRKHVLIILFTLLILGSNQRIHAQIDEMCAEFGAVPSLNSPFVHIPYIYGKVTFIGFLSNAKKPKVTVTLIDRDQTQKRLTIGEKGNYCFKPLGGGGTLIVEADGIEATRRTLPAMSASQQREDFEIHAGQSAKAPVASKFTHPPNEMTTEFYRLANEAEVAKNTKQAILHFRSIVEADAEDFIAWTKLGALFLKDTQYDESENALRKALQLKPEYTTAWIYAGQVRVARKQYEAAAEVFKHATTLEPSSARIYQLLGEVYLLSKQGSLGVEALNKAIGLDPIGMAECHLQLAHLYQLAKQNKLATREYKAFLRKVPEYAEKKKLEKFVAENPE